MTVRTRVVNIRDVTFLFTGDVERDYWTTVHVTVEQPVYREQTFDVLSDVDPVSYAQGWWHHHVRDVLHLL